MHIFESENIVFALILGVYAVINSFSFALFAWDKYTAKYGGRRIRERTLLLISLVFGALGSLAAMMCLHHKTKHRSFTLSVPFMLILHIIILFLLL